MAKKEIKTNAMRILDRLKIPYEHQSYECAEFTDGIQTADQLGLPHALVYKTLVTTAGKSDYFVFVLPIEEELDLKKAAKAADVKALSLIHVKEITQITGYVRGGCTSIGMKKKFPTFIDASAQKLPKIYISGGRIGCQLRLAPQDLCKAVDAQFADLVIHNK